MYIFDIDLFNIFCVVMGGTFIQVTGCSDVVGHVLYCIRNGILNFIRGYTKFKVEPQKLFCPERDFVDGTKIMKS